MRLPLLLFGLLLVAGWICVNRGHSSQKPAPPAVSSQAAQSFKFELQGAGSCAAMACHNADALTGFARREYKIALERDFSGEIAHVKDKHAQAFSVLFEERSQRMLRQWKGLPAGQAAHPEREALCLRCHVHPGYDADLPGHNRHPVRVADGVSQFRLEDGVSCEACHGPAERWLAAHFRPGWRELSAERRAEFGMADTRSVLGRVSVCVRCHVGSKDAEVDHDLIAAGHPWLRFEASDYHARWHRHWDIAKDKNPSLSARAKPDFEARLWVVGQVASAKAALDLLAERAGDAKRPWPEFAEHDCFACHHDLQGKTPRPLLGDKVGAPVWNAWYTAMLPAAAGEWGAAKLDKSLRDLRPRMASWQPQRQQVAADARQAAAELAAWLAQWADQEPGPMAVDMIAGQLLAAGDTQTADSWTTAAQWQRALAAVERARHDLQLSPPPWSVHLPRLENALSWPSGFASPRDYDAAGVRKLITTMKSDGRR